MLIITDDTEIDNHGTKKLKFHSDNSFSITFVPQSNFSSRVVINDKEIMGAKRYFKLGNLTDLEAIFNKNDADDKSTKGKFINIKN